MHRQLFEFLENILLGTVDGESRREYNFGQGRPAAGDGKDPQLDLREIGDMLCREPLTLFPHQVAQAATQPVPFP